MREAESNGYFSPSKVKPEKPSLAKERLNQTIDQATSNLSRISDSMSRYDVHNKKIRDISLPKRFVSKRSSSTYESQFEDSPAKRSKGKLLNPKVNLKMDQLKNQLKFPPIPKGQVRPEFIHKNPIQSSLKTHGKLYKIGSKFKRDALNTTIDEPTTTKNILNSKVNESSQKEYHKLGKN